MGDRYCDKCGEVVLKGNNALFVDIEAGYLNKLALFVLDGRHLFPTENCEGSPSRAQYHEGIPRDTRGYGYDPSREQRLRDALARIREHGFFREGGKDD